MGFTDQDGRFTVMARALIALICAVAYVFLFQLNFMLFAELEFSEGVNWIFLPSGLRLLLVLVLDEVGAIGIILGSLAINYLYVDSAHPNYHVFNTITAFISGFAPYLARKIAVDGFNIDVNLQGMTPRIFFKITLLFALISPALHQLWFYWCCVTENFVASTFAMFVGDWLGTVLIIGFANLCINAFTHLKNGHRLPM